MGDRVLSDLNRLKITVELAVDGNPKIAPASTVNVTSDVATGAYLVEEMQTTMSAEDGYKANLTCSSYPGSVDIEPTTSGGIVADFSAIQVVSFGDPKLMTTFDGSASYSQYGVITTWRWDWPDSTTTTSTAPIAQYAFDQASISNGNSQNVTLTVTDELGNTAVTTSGITYESLTAGIQVLYRQLYAALTTKAAGSLDGGAVWTVKDLSAISVAASNFASGGVFVASGYALFGTSIDTGVWRTGDCLASITKVLPTSSDPVTAVHVAELDGRYALAGTQSGSVYVSRDSGTTWNAVTSVGVPVREIRHAYTNYDYILVVGSGINKVYESFDLGQHWSLFSGTSDIDANRESSGTATNYFGHASGVRGVLGGLPSNLTFSGGGTRAVPALTVAVDNDQGVMIVDSTGQHWNADDGVLAPTEYNPTNTTKHMLRDGDVLGVVYYATTSGVYKSLDGNHTIAALYTPSGSLPADGWGRQVAYGPLAPITAPARIFVQAEFGSPYNSTGWFVSSGNAWQFLRTAALDQRADATDGYLIWGASTSINMFEVAGSGIIQHINYATLPSPGGALPRVYSVSVSRRGVAGSGIFPTVFVMGGAGGGDDTTIDLYRYDSFFTEPSIYTYVLSPVNMGSIFDAASQRMTGYQDNFIHTFVQPGLFASSMDHYAYDGENMTVEQVTGGSPNSAYPFWFATTPLENWVIYGADTEAKLQENDGATVDIDYLDNLGTRSVWSSSMRPTTLYVGYSTGDAYDPGIYTIENLGRGRMTQLLEAPANAQTLRSLFVTHDRAQTQDYITAVFDRSDVQGAYLYYSLDGGATWQLAPDIPYGASGTAFIEAYYVGPVS